MKRITLQLAILCIAILAQQRPLFAQAAQENAAGAKTETRASTFIREWLGAGNHFSEPEN